MRTADEMNHDRLLRKKEVAQLLACSTRMVERLVSGGKLTRILVLGAVRYRLSEVRQIMAGGCA